MNNLAIIGASYLQLPLIKKAREMTGADAIVVVMSGHFTQRGMPAFFRSFSVKNAARCGFLTKHGPVRCVPKNTPSVTPSPVSFSLLPAP